MTPGSYDALLLMSFGGPEKPDDVVPFLENVTRGRGIPRERLAEVGEHYFAFGGRSPINDQNKALLAALRGELDRRGIALPVYWGNRNWEPYLVDVLRQAHADGARRVLMLATSAYASYSGCRQYREDVARALTALAAEGITLEVDKLRHFFNHPGFVDANTDAVVDAVEALTGRVGDAGPLHVAFVTHSIPDAMAEVSGPDGHAYERQHEDVAAVVAARAAERNGRRLEHSLVYCSRSGPPTQPWLEPDVNDHLSTLKEQGVAGAVLAPIGFVSDHMEVRYDLDTEAAQTAADLGLPIERAGTAGVHEAFVAGLVDLVAERFAVGAGGEPRHTTTGSLPASHDVCPVGCCRNLRAPDTPAACGEDWVPPQPTTPTGAPLP